jgi:hypothetical protein
VVNPNLQETVSLVTCVLLLLLVPPLPSAADGDGTAYLGVPRDRLRAGVGAVLVLALIWHLLAILGGVVLAIKRALRNWNSKADSRPEVHVRGVVALHALEMHSRIGSPLWAH